MKQNDGLSQCARGNRVASRPAHWCMYRITTQTSKKSTYIVRPVHNNNDVEATLSNATSQTILSIKSTQVEYILFVSTLSKESFDL